MAKKKKLNALKELVTVAFAEDIELATQYKHLLNDNDIPAAIKSRPDPEVSFHGIAIQVPVDYLDEAYILIENQSSISDFYDFDDYDYNDDYYY